MRNKHPVPLAMAIIWAGTLIASALLVRDADQFVIVLGLLCGGAAASVMVTAWRWSRRVQRSIPILVALIWAGVILIASALVVRDGDKKSDLLPIILSGGASASVTVTAFGRGRETPCCGKLRS